MMKGKVFSVLVIIILLFFGSCSDDMQYDSLDYAELISTFDFESADQLWEGGISDYPLDFKDSLHYYVANEQLTSANAVYDGNSLSISADNPHGDLFYYFKKKISGFKPKTTYKLDFEFLLFSELGDNQSIPKDQDLFLKMGGVNFDPSLRTEQRHFSEYVTLNVDKGGSNEGSGKDIVNLGSMKNFLKDQPGSVSGNTFDVPMEVKSDADGAIWLLIGVDSGVKSPLTFSLAAVTVYYSEILG